MSPEVKLPETRVISREIYSHLARYLKPCRQKFRAKIRKNEKNQLVHMLSESML